jgi:hypothetical protein
VNNALKFIQFEPSSIDHLVLAFEYRQTLRVQILQIFQLGILCELSLN